MQISDSSIRILAGLLEARTGQQLTMSRRWRIETALAALLRERGIGSLDELITILVMNKEPGLSSQVVEALLNNETYFFRDRTPFDTLLKHVLPALAVKRASKKRIRIWSAGCSTGQEAYSLAMLFADDPIKWRGWTIDILGTDVSGAVIDRARSGVYTQFEVQRGLGDHPDDSLVRGMRRRLADRRPASQERPLPRPQFAGRSASQGRLRHRALPQRPALPLLREEGAGIRPARPRRWPKTAGSCSARARR